MGIFNLEDVHYWIYSPGNNAVNWDDYYERGIMAIERNELGDLSAYSSKEEMRRPDAESDRPDALVHSFRT